MTPYERSELHEVIISDLRAELNDTRRDRDTAEAEVKELKATIEEIRKELIQMTEYIRGR